MIGELLPERIKPYLPDLAELRKRALYCLYAFILVSIPLIVFSKTLYGVVSQSLLKHLPDNAMLIATHVSTPFTAPLKLALFASLLLNAPYFLYHIWRFITPGLYQHEKRAVFPTLFLSVGLFYTGIAFAQWVICPITLLFFHQSAPPGVTVMTDITHLLDFIISLYLACGFAFQIPIVTVVLCKIGLTTKAQLKQKRPHIILGAFIVGMLLTPPDVISQCLLAIPMIALFELGLLMVPKKQ